MVLRRHLILSALAGLVVATAVTGCGSESPDTPAPAPSAAATPAMTSAVGVSERVAAIDFVDAHLSPAAGPRTFVQATLANTDPAHRHDLVKVTADGARARITGPGSGGPPGRLPFGAATHVDTLAGTYTITLPFRTSPDHGAVPVTFAFTGNPSATLTLPVLRH